MIAAPPRPGPSTTPTRPGSPVRATRQGRRPAAAGHPRRSTPAAGERGPRLLLPPVVEPDGARLTAVGYLPPSVRSMNTSPVTDEARAWPRASDEPAQQTATTLPDPTAACGVIALAVVEMIAGRRAPAQLLRWVTPELYDRLVLHAATAPASAAPARAARLLSTHPCRVDTEVAEAAVVLHDGARVRAAAVRVEAHRGRWRATAVEIG